MNTKFCQAWEKRLHLIKVPQEDIFPSVFFASLSVILYLMSGTLEGKYFLELLKHLRLCLQLQICNHMVPWLLKSLRKAYVLMFKMHFTLVLGKGEPSDRETSWLWRSLLCSISFAALLKYKGHFSDRYLLTKNCGVLFLENLTVLLLLGLYACIFSFLKFCRWYKSGKSGRLCYHPKGPWQAWRNGPKGTPLSSAKEIASPASSQQ